MILEMGGLSYQQNKTLVLPTSNYYFSNISSFFYVYLLFLAMLVVGRCFLAYFIGLIVASGVLVAGLAKMNRGMMLPWMILFGIAVLFQLVFGLWLLGGYYIYVSVKHSKKSQNL